MKESRHIRSFVKRQHRMTPGQARAWEAFWPNYGLDVNNTYFKGEEGYILEIGFGMGTSLVRMAMKYPEKKFIGIEVHKPGIGALLIAANKYGTTNIKIFNDDAIIVLNKCISDESLSQILIYFPDPWPKKRHQKRRLIQAEFIRLLHLKLKQGGQLHLATDCQDYAEHMLKILENHFGFYNYEGPFKYLSHTNGRSITKFEKRSLDSSRPVWDLLYIKQSADLS